MKILYFVSWDDFYATSFLKKELIAGNVILGSSDTVIGLLATATASGRKALDEIKEKRGDNSYIVLVRDREVLSNFVEFPLLPAVQRLVDFFWPGPLTLIFKAHSGCSQDILSVQGKIAIRIPGHPAVLRLLNNFSGLLSTSANKSGERVPRCISEVQSDILTKISAVVESADIFVRTIPSTILDVSSEPFILIREGYYSTKVIESAIGTKLQIKN